LSKIIRKVTNTKPFNKLELGILKWMFKTLDGVLSRDIVRDIMKKDFKNMFGLSKEEVMYFVGLYNENYLQDGSFEDITLVTVPLMLEYDVEYMQDVSAYRSLEHKVWAADEDDALDAMEWDFDYNYQEDSGLTYYVDDTVETGDYQDVFDQEIHQSNSTPLNETKIIIKKILKGYGK
tara:strand:+ start:499 stop:1032 length:534 start_codon:yes stop_codon:yes gene_type:complete